jgi:TolA-binding protein
VISRKHIIHPASKAGSVCITLMVVLSCAYFNTVYNAKNYYHQAKKSVTHDTLITDSDNFDKAIEKSTSIIVKYPNTRWIDDALFMMGASYYYKGDYSRSLDKLDFLVTNYPQSGFRYEAQYLMGLANYKLKKHGSAVVALKEAMNSKKFKKKAMMAMLYVYYSDANYSDLYEVADTLVRGSLKYDERRTVLSLVGMAQFEEERYDVALETATQLLAITRVERERRDLKLRIAEIYLEIDEYELCKDFLIGEQDPEFRDLLADLYMEIGNDQSAKEICLDLAHSSMADVAAEAYYELGGMYEEEDSVDLAIAYYDSALVRSPNSEYGLSARKKSDVLKRIQSLNTATEDVVRAQFLLAEIYFADLADLPKALEGYQKVYNDHPASEWAPKALYAHLWIVKNILRNDTLALALARNLIGAYPRTEYAVSAQGFLHELQEKDETHD